MATGATASWSGGVPHLRKVPCPLGSSYRHHHHCTTQVPEVRTWAGGPSPDSIISLHLPQHRHQTKLYLRYIVGDLSLSHPSSIGSRTPSARFRSYGHGNHAVGRAHRPGREAPAQPTHTYQCSSERGSDDARPAACAQLAVQCPYQRLFCLFPNHSFMYDRQPADCS